MKKFVLLLPLLFAFGLFSHAQNDIQLNIHHKLGADDFALYTAAVNNLNNNFNVTRLEYYISEISILHDGGNETMIEDLWILVDATEPTQVDLGSHNLNEVEGIRLHIGVDEEHNHLDPGSYPSGHPLAPQLPSMHWGWAAGYRFIAYEGNGGPLYNQLFQLHGLGNDNYFQTEIPLTANAIDGQIDINLDADYARGLEDIVVKSGVIVHGEDGAAKKSLENFRDYVFSPSATVSSTSELSILEKVEIYPNPGFDGTANLVVSTTEELTFDVVVSDLLGRKIQQVNSVQGNTGLQLNLDGSGLHFISVVVDGKVLATKKLMLK